MKIRASFVVMVATVVLAAAASPVSAADKDCSDFSTWKQAQRFYKKHGGPRYDPHRLDADRDGIACESLL